MSMTGLGAGSHQQAVVASSVSGGDAVVFLMGALFKNQGPWLVSVGGFGPRSDFDSRLGFTLVGFHSTTREGRWTDSLLLLLNAELWSVCR